MKHSNSLQEEQKGVLRHSLFAVCFCGLMLWAGYVLIPHWFDLSAARDSRMGLALSASFFVLLWVLFAVILVSTGPFFSKEDVRGSAYAPPSSAIAVKSAFLQNTLEQAVLAVGVYVVLANRLPARGLALIPTAAVLFAIGRATFLLGYVGGARGRSFGMATTMLPTLFLYFLAAVLMMSGG